MKEAKILEPHKEIRSNYVNEEYFSNAKFIDIWLFFTHIYKESSSQVNDSESRILESF